jgi:hypothetical protein
MKKLFVTALVATTLLGAGAASAQRFDIGPDGPSVDLRSGRQRERDEIRREEMRRDREMERRAASREREGCREVTIRERDAYGNVEVRRRRDCR